MDVDKAGGEDPSGPVDLPRSSLAPPRFDGRYPSVTDGDINRSRRAAGAINDSGAADQQIVHAFPQANDRLEQVYAYALGQGWSNRFIDIFPHSGSLRSSVSLRVAG